MSTILTSFTSVKLLPRGFLIHTIPVLTAKLNEHLIEELIGHSAFEIVHRKDKDKAIRILRTIDIYSKASQPSYYNNWATCISWRKNDISCKL